MITQEIIEFKNKAMTKSLLATKKAIISLTTDIIYDTPVDTGRLRNNWIPSINKSETSYSMLGSDTSKRKSKERPTLQETITKVNTLKLGDTFYFTNNLPYAKRIEFDGWSAKAPQGMVRKNLLKWSKYFV